MSAPSPFLYRFEEKPAARLRLLCFSHAGGSAGAFAAWQRALPPEVEVDAVQLPGRESRRSEAFVVDMSELLRALSTALREVHTRPTVLFGHSLGALIAFEYARAMRAAQNEPLQLLVSASHAPQKSRAPAISHLPRPDFIREMTERYDGIPKVVREDPELLDYYLPILRADLQLFESYNYSEALPLTCPIHAFGGNDDRRIGAAELTHWSAQTSADFTTEIFPGGHFFLTSAREPLMKTLNRRLQHSLDRL